MPQSVLIRSPILVTDRTPVTACVAIQEFFWGLVGLGQCFKGTGSCDCLSDAEGGQKGQRRKCMRSSLEALQIRVVANAPFRSRYNYGMSGHQRPYFPPCQDVPLLNSRPPLSISSLKRFAIKVGARWLRQRNNRRYLAKLDRTSQLLTEAGRCHDRAQLESLLGKPVYSMNGDCFAIIEANGAEKRPDCVEVYLTDGCQIDVWYFMQPREIEMSGCPAMTATDVVL